MKHYISAFASPEIVVKVSGSFTKMRYVIEEKRPGNVWHRLIKKFTDMSNKL